VIASEDLAKVGAATGAAGNILAHNDPLKFCQLTVETRMPGFGKLP
jgi:hypothetical protein